MLFLGVWNDVFYSAAVLRPSLVFPQLIVHSGCSPGCCHIPGCVYSSWIWDAHQLSAELHSASRISKQEWHGKKKLYSSFATKGNISYNVQQLQNCFPGWGSRLQCCCKTNPDLHNSSRIFPQLIYNLVWSYLAVIWITRLYVIIDDITRIFTLEKRAVNWQRNVLFICPS